jgi:hypothetical protein
MTLLSVLPLQAGNQHEEPTGDGFLQQRLVHGPELPSDVVLIASI